MIKINTSKYTLFLGISSILIILFCSIENRNQNKYYWFEAESFNKITSGLEIIKDDDASNKKIIISRLQSHITRAYAQYNFNVSQSGEYTFWARTFWPGGCNNSFLVTVNNSPKLQFGNDPLLRKWHWVKGPILELQAGENELQIWNDERLAQIDMFLLTNDNYYEPTGTGKGKNITVNINNKLPDVLKFKSKSNWKVIKTVHKENQDKFLINDIKNYTGFLARLRTGNRVSEMIVSKFSNKFIEEIINESSVLTLNDDQKKWFIKELNNTLNETLYDDYTFSFIPLDQKLIEELNTDLSQKQLRKINHKLIKEMYPDVFVDEDYQNSIYLKLLNEKSPEYFVFKNSPRNDFVLKCDLIALPKNSRNKKAQFIFDFVNNKNYKYLEWGEKNTINLYKIKEGKSNNQIYHVDDLPILSQNTSTFTAIRQAKGLTILFDGKCVLSLDNVIQNKTGLLGLGSTTGEISFRNISLLEDFEPIYQEIFFEHYSWPKSIHMMEKQGYWNVGRAQAKALIGKKIPDNPAAMILDGKDYWHNYYISVAINNPTGKPFGIIKDYQDSLNYYLAMWEKESSDIGTFQLLKIKNGVTSIIAEKECQIIPGQWYKILLGSTNDSIFLQVDDKTLLKKSCPENKYGKFGFLTDAEKEYACFANILVSSMPKHTNNIVQYYDFEIRQNAANDLSAWIQCEHSFNLTHPDLFFTPIVFKKEYNKPLILKHKNILQYSPSNIHVSTRNDFYEGIVWQIYLETYYKKNIKDYSFSVSKTFVDYATHNKNVRKEINLSQLKNINIYFQSDSISIYNDSFKILEVPEKVRIDSFNINIIFKGSSPEDITFNNILIQ